jgi:hypothetical protein
MRYAAIMLDAAAAEDVGHRVGLAATTTTT